MKKLEHIAKCESSLHADNTIERERAKITNQEVLQKQGEQIVIIKRYPTETALSCKMFLLKYKTIRAKTIRHLTHSFVNIENPKSKKC